MVNIEIYPSIGFENCKIILFNNGFLKYDEAEIPWLVYLMNNDQSLYLKNIYQIVTDTIPTTNIEVG